MGVEQEIEAIRLGIKAGRSSNEASVSQGIVLRLLHALGSGVRQFPPVFRHFPDVAPI